MLSPFFIVGPTAVGKTGIAIAVAERCDAEVVNADAFQLYAGLDVLAAKPSAQERLRVPHHLVGTVLFSEIYDVARYRKQARQCLDEIAHTGRTALVVGGSGLYVKSLTHGLSSLPPAQPGLRGELDALDLETLRRRLFALDPVTAGTIDAKNKRRLVRAVEVCETTGRPFSAFREEWSSPGTCATPIGVLLTRSKPELDARIKQRVAAMFAQNVVEEVRAVPSEYAAGPASKMIGWREIQAHLRGEIDVKICMKIIEIATRQYAKRQMTWFRRETVFEAMSLDGDDFDTRTVDRICERIRQPVRRDLEVNGRGRQ